MLPPRVHDLRGLRFGRLEVLRFAGRRRQPSGYATTLWACQCDCGRQTVAMAWALKHGSTKSCGCLQRQRAVETHTRHGHTRRRRQSVEYQCWRSMIDRCTNRQNQSFESYGGRGISVCVRWRYSFENFLADMGPRPQGRSIDRMDNDGNYEPGNCRWATKKEQGRNRSNNTMLTAIGETLTLAEWSERTGLNVNTLGARLSCGWPPERIVSEKPKQPNAK